MATTTDGTYTYEVHTVASGASASAPTAVDGTDGQQLRDLKGLTVIVSAENTRTLSGAGNLRCYILDKKLARWVRLHAGDLAVTATGVRDQAFAASEIIAARAGFIKWIPDAVTYSAGTTLTVHQLGYNPKLAAQYAAT